MSQSSSLHYRTFLLLLVVVSIAFGWLLWPFYGAVFWGTILAIIFAPLQRRLVPRIGGRRNLAALITLALVLLLIVILPLVVISRFAGAGGRERLPEHQVRQTQLRRLFPAGGGGLAAIGAPVAGAFRPGRHLSSLQEKLSAGAMQASQVVATKAFSIGQNTFEFVISFGIMLYLLFFLLRDGPVLGRRIKQAMPLSEEHKHHLFAKFTTVIRATVKGNIAVAATQGALGGLIFWLLGIQGALLWGTLMAFLSLLPAIGAGLIWAPVAAYFLLTGAIWQGVVLIAVLRGGDRSGGQHPAPDPGRQGHQDARLRGADLHPRRHGPVRPQRLRHRPADRGAVHGQLGPVHWPRGSCRRAGRHAGAAASRDLVHPGRLTGAMARAGGRRLSAVKTTSGRSV